MAAIDEIVAGRYRIVRPLAAGGMGRVWLATDERHGRPVALKECVPPGGLTAAERALVARWALPEAQAFAEVRHPNLVPVLDVLPGAGAPWIVMEYVPSRSLLEVVGESGGLPPHRVAAIGLAVLDALDAAARAGLVHLDVKPANVLIADDGRILLTDCGPAVTPAGRAALAAAGIAFGSPKYLAPERLGGGGATGKADLWSLGATLYHAVEGRPPYGWGTTEATLRAIARTDPEPPRRAGPLAAVLAGLLRRDPADRMSPVDAAAGLRRVITRRSRRRLLTAAAAVVLAAGLTGGVQALARGGEPPADPPPAGFTWQTDPAGFRVAVPAGWRPADDTEAGAVVLSPPAGGPSLRITQWVPPPPDVVAALTAEEREVRLAGYRRIRIEALPSPPGAVWEFTYRDPVAGPMRVLRRVVTDGGRTCLVEWRAPRAGWAAGQPTLAVVLASFQPGGRPARD
jgi:hypothetical protein